MDVIRRLRFRTGRARYSLTVWDTHRRDHRGQSVLGYELVMRDPRETVFRGEDFAGSPLHADDSDATMGALLSFLCLRPGDTDADYFRDYTPAQLDWARAESEELYHAVCDRFGEV